MDVRSVSRRRPQSIANDNPGEIVLAAVPCAACRVLIAERAPSIYVVVGTDVRGWCSPVCAASGGVWPWAAADQAIRATWV